LINGKLFSWFVFLASRQPIASPTDRLEQAIREFVRFADIAGQLDGLNTYNHEVSLKKNVVGVSAMKLSGRDEKTAYGSLIEFLEDPKAIYRWVEHVHATTVGRPEHIFVSRGHEDEFECWSSYNGVPVFRASVLALDTDVIRESKAARSELADSSRAATGWDQATEDRNKWIYDKAIAGVTWKTIQIQLQKQPIEWEQITTEQGVRAAAQAYVDRHDCPPVPPRKRGRQPKA